MESNQRKTITFEVPTKEEITAKRPLIPASFGVAILMFFLPFCDIQCTNGQKITTVTGLQLITGKSMNTAGGVGDFGQSPQKIPANIWAILTLLAAIGGLVVYLRKHPKEALAGAAAGGIGFISLVILKITAGMSAGAMKDVPIEVDFRFAFWLAMLALGAAGGVSYLRYQAEKKQVPDVLYSKPKDIE